MTLMGRDGMPPYGWFVWYHDISLQSEMLLYAALGAGCCCTLLSDWKSFVYMQLILSYLGPSASKHLIEQDVSVGEGNRAVKGVLLALPEFLSSFHLIFFFLLAHCGVEKGATR